MYEHQRHPPEPEPEQQQKQSKIESLPTKPLLPKPSLLLLSKDVLRPPSSILHHVTIYSRHLNIPTLVLPGRASSELGQALGMKCAAVILILSSTSSDKEGVLDDDDINGIAAEDEDGKKEREDRREVHEDIDSFVTYAVNKIPKI